VANERNSETLARNALLNLGYYESEDLTVEEQQSKNATIKRLLRAASKSGSAPDLEERRSRHDSCKELQCQHHHTGPR
jgi:hypothetical protein